MRGRVSKVAGLGDSRVRGAALAGAALVGAVVYLYYRTSFAPNEPFGPLYEWTAATAIALALVLYFASRSSAAHADASLPPPGVRHHRQSVRTLRDPSHEILRGLVLSFVERGQNARQLADELSRISDFSDALSTEALRTYAARPPGGRAGVADPGERGRRLVLVRRILERFEEGIVEG